MVSSVNRLYISNEEVFSISSVKVGVTVLGLHELLCKSGLLHLLNIDKAGIRIEELLKILGVAVTYVTTSINIQKLYILPTKCLYVLYVSQKKKHVSFP